MGLFLSIIIFNAPPIKLKEIKTLYIIRMSERLDLNDKQLEKLIPLFTKRVELEYKLKFKRRQFLLKIHRKLRRGITDKEAKVLLDSLILWEKNWFKVLQNSREEIFKYLTPKQKLLFLLAEGAIKQELIKKNINRKRRNK